MEAVLAIPRLVVSAVESGAGKTTVMVALAAALRSRGLSVAVFKCGPDYLDPTWHAAAAGQPSHNLDGWMMGRDAVCATFVRGARGCDVALIEGMMGLFDGATPLGEEGSTAELAKWLDAPVLLVVNAAGMARTVGAIAEGFSRFDPGLRLAGLLCNRVGGRAHLELLRAASPAVAVAGGLPEKSDAAMPERHLGLVGATHSSIDKELVARWGAVAAQWFDLDAILTVARTAPPLPALSVQTGSPHRETRCRIGIARDDAFHFYYEDNLNRLMALGAEIKFFSPISDPRLPEVDGLCFGGGYPEVAAERLSGNAAMTEAVRRFAGQGRPIYAECGGLMYLAQAIRTLDGRRWPTVGLIPGEAVMADQLQAIGYVAVATRAASILGPAGLSFRGHQFRYSTLTDGAESERIYEVSPRWGGAPFQEGYRAGSVLASYVHAHWASNPRVAAGFVDSCIRSRRRLGRR